MIAARPNVGNKGAAGPSMDFGHKMNMDGRHIAERQNAIRHDP